DRQLRVRVAVQTGLPAPSDSVRVRRAASESGAPPQDHGVRDRYAVGAPPAEYHQPAAPVAFQSDSIAEDDLHWRAPRLRLAQQRAVEAVGGDEPRPTRTGVRSAGQVLQSRKDPIVGGPAA